MIITKLRIISIVTIIGIMLAVLSGCAETPQEDIVTNKTENTPVTESEAAASATTIADSFEITGSKPVDFSFSNDSGSVSFNIQSEMDTLSADSLPVYSAKLHYFTSEDVKSMVHCVLGDTDVFEFTEQLPRSTIEERILKLRQSISDRDALLEYYQGNTETVERVIKKRNEEIAALEAELVNAPEEVVRLLSDYSFHSPSYYSTENSGEYSLFNYGEDTQTWRAAAERDGIPFFLDATKYQSSDYELSKFFMFPYDIISGHLERYYYQTVPFTDEEIVSAENMTNTILDSFLPGDWRIEDTIMGDDKVSITEDGSNHSYSVSFSCVPYYNSVPLIDPIGTTMYAEAYRPNSYSTELVITVSKGIVTDVDCLSPLDTEAAYYATLLSEDEAIEKIKEQLTYKFTSKFIANQLYGAYGIGDISAATVNVYKIRLSYVRVNVRDKEHEYLLLPAWIVYGYYQSGDDSPALDENGAPYMEALLVVNAADGSMIDLTGGY